ncbi:MAG: DUF1015 domain-containing protein [Desulforhabdus sp.]|jgi:uncharacterized protein (DUF1015 family)|nr:DUF1015 domain-containing protein [Desulforhabdus sp.]
MAEIAPFRGFRYNLERIPDLSEVVIPPYDVISKREQELFHLKHPYNMIRLELGESTSDDSEQNNAHTRAACYMQEWLKEKIFIRDDQPAIYYYELEYSLRPQTRQTRYGFLCLLRLEDFAGGGVRPHERTFQAIKDERLRLMLACQANLSPVFALYSDPAQLVDHHLRGGREPDELFSFKDENGMIHRMWRVKNLTILQQVRSLMLDKAIFIADGHHRYETALNYRNIQRERFKNGKPQAPYEYVMIYLSNMNQGGLTILPTHRLLRNINSWEPQLFLKQAQAFFEIVSYKADEGGQRAWRSKLDEAGSRNNTAIGFYSRKVSSFYLLQARREAVSTHLAQVGIPEVLHDLDVVVLDTIVLRHLLGLSEALLADENNINFKHDLLDALLNVQSGDYEVGFFINPTRIEQVQNVATAGLIMPHKSTYFYPKVGSGLVINPLYPNEEILS